MNYVIGMDAGTTSFKAGVYDEKLKTVKTVSEGYELNYSDEGYVEFSPEKYWQIFCRLIKRLIDETGIPKENIKGISICSQGETMICLDKKGNPLYEAIVWTDARACSQADEMKKHFSKKEIFEVTGQTEISASWPATKLIWLKENKPDVYGDISHVLMLEDYLIYRLTGCFATDKSISSSTLYLDIYSGAWWDKMLDYIDLDSSKLPEIYESGKKIAYVNAGGCDESGLDSTTAVISGALDQASGMLGAGNIKEGIITETTGTCLAVCSNIGKKQLKYKESLLPTHYGILPGSYYTIYWSPAAGSIYKWLSEVCYSSEKGDLFNIIDNEADKIPPGCNGLYLMPYLSGMNYPSAKEDARGIFTGISLTHTRGHFARATLESIAFLLRQSIDEIKKCNIATDKIYSLGGGSSSVVWNRIKADFTGKPIVTLHEKETTCKGAGAMAAVGSGIIEDYESAIALYLKEKDTFLPRERESCDYDSIYKEFSDKMSKYYL